MTQITYIEEEVAPLVADPHYGTPHLGKINPFKINYQTNHGIRKTKKKCAMSL